MLFKCAYRGWTNFKYNTLKMFSNLKKQQRKSTVESTRNRWVAHHTDKVGVAMRSIARAIN